MRLCSFWLVVICLAASLPSPCLGDEARVGAVRVLRVPRGGLHPQAQVDAAGVLHLIYFKGKPDQGDIFYTRSADGGERFAPPLRVNSQPGSALIIGAVRGPQMALGRNGRIHVAWMGSRDAEPQVPGGHTPMLYARLNDAGDQFEPQRNVIQKHPGLDGGGSIAADGQGNVYVAWHAPEDLKNAEGEAGRRVWLIRSEDEGRTFGAEVPADPEPRGACACCGMRIAADAAGNVYVLYRTASESVHRDTHLLASGDQGRSFRVIAQHPWRIAACVMSTPDFAPGPASVLAAWETEQRVFLAGIDPASSFSVSGPTAAPGKGTNRKHPRLAVNGTGQTLLAWTEGTAWNRGGSVAWQLFDSDGHPLPDQSGRADDLPTWGIPAVVALSEGRFAVIY